MIENRMLDTITTLNKRFYLTSNNIVKIYIIATYKI